MRPQLGETITVPGWLDIHVHCREPSPINKSETFKNASRTAVKNGNIALCDMSNNPGRETWTNYRVNEKARIIRRDAYLPIGLWAGSQPTERCNNIGQLRLMAKHCIGLKSYATVTTGNEVDYQAEDFREAYTEWHRWAPHQPIGLHSGENNLEQFIELAAELGQPLHVCHVNNPEDVDLIARFKKQGLRITCGVTVDHLLLDSHDELTQGWWARMKPPLATQVDSEKLRYQFNAGDIDILETDHAPHPPENKAKAETNNPEGHDHGDTCFGTPSLDTASGMIIRQVMLGNIDDQRYIDGTGRIPAAIVGVKIAPNTSVTWKLEEYRITERNTRVRAETSPYLGFLAVGRVLRTVIKGRVIYDKGQHLDKAGRLLTTGQSI